MAACPPESPWITLGCLGKKRDPGPELVGPESFILRLFRAWSEVPKVRVELTRGHPHRFLSLVPYVLMRFSSPVVLGIRA